MSNKVYIRPVPRESIQGRNSFRIVDGVKVGTTKAKGGSFTFQAQVSKQTGDLAFNLDRLVDNPYYVEDEENKNLPVHWADSNIWRRPQITRQQQLELKWNKKPGFFHTESFSPNGNLPFAKRERSYLQTLSIILIDGLNVLDMKKMDHELLYEAMLASSLIANSMEEIDGTTRFYISHVEEEQEQLANKRRRKMEATAILNDLLANNKTKMTKVAVVLKIVQGMVSEDVVTNKLYDYINEESYGSTRLPERIERFINVASKATAKTQADVEAFENEYFGQQLVNYRVVSDFKGKYTWISKADTNLEEIARSKPEYLRWLSDIDNAHYVEQLREELMIKK